MVKLPPVLAACLLVALLPGGVSARPGGAASTTPGGAAAIAQEDARPVTIGLFLPTKGQGAGAGTEARRGAEMAAAWANRSGGIRGRPVRLAIASSDAGWSAATDALVRLIYDESAVAIVGALDGPTGHLAEQVITRAKGQTVFVTPWASETTLTRIRIPWFFQMVPDDRRQGEALAREIFSARGIRRVAVVAQKGLDPESAAAAFNERAPEGAVTSFDAGQAGDRSELAERAARGDFGAVILFANAGAAIDLVRTLSRTGSVPALFGPLSLAGPDFLAAGKGGSADGIHLPAPAGLWSTPAASEFRNDYRKNYAASPTLLAAYSHDAVKVLVEALRRLRSAESDGLAATLASLRTGGATGEIRFDNHLGRDAVPILARVKGDDLVPLGRALPAERR